VTGRTYRAWLPALVALCLSAPKKPARAEIGRHELVVIVHPANTASVSPSDLENIFLLKRRRWAGGPPILPFNYPPTSPLRRSFDRQVLRFSHDQAARYWLDQRIRTGLRAPRQVSDPALAVKLVARIPGAIAYVPAELVDRQVRVAARIRRGRVLAP
jgi:ABC-type phosphate transport system substrate-binding protein